MDLKNNGSRMFCRLEDELWSLLEVSELLMLEWVVYFNVSSIITEKLRVPSKGSTMKGESAPKV